MRYEVWVDMEDGSRMTGQYDEAEIEEMRPITDAINSGQLHWGHDRDLACFTTLDVWMDILGYPREDFVLATSVTVEPVREGKHTLQIVNGRLIWDG